MGMNLSSKVVGRGSRFKRSPMADINVTPMVDVMLVLLVIFMVTAQFIVGRGINVDLPSAQSSEASGTVSISGGAGNGLAGGTLSLNGGAGSSSAGARDTDALSERRQCSG